MHVPSFAPVAQHHLFLLDTTMERNFPWLYHQISSRGEDFNLLFIVSNSSIKFMSAFKHRHSFSKLGESKSLHFWKDQLSGNSDIFQIRQNSIGSLYQQVSLSPFLCQRPKQTLKEKLCTEHLSRSLPQIIEYEKYPILESFLGFF